LRKGIKRKTVWGEVKKKKDSRLSYGEKEEGVFCCEELLL